MSEEIENGPDSGCLQLIEGLETTCHQCLKKLCLRQQVLNLALGEDKDLLCLACLAQANGKASDQLLASLGPYVQSRQCFYKEWRKYASESACPDPLGCLPKSCFSFT
jgi:hypothetical protein